MRNLIHFCILSLILVAGVGYADRSDTITQKLRCLVCQNETVYESNTLFSYQITQQVKRQISEGLTDKEIYKNLQLKYGDVILFDPDFNQKTMLLWFIPSVIGMMMLIYILKLLNTLFCLKKNNKER